MRLLEAPGRATVRLPAPDPGALLACREGLEAAEAVRLLPEPERLRGLQGFELLRERPNLLALLPLPGAPGRAFLKAFAPRGLLARLRAPRALRAWNAACEILARGVATPEPLALALPGAGRWREGALLAEHRPGRQIREYLGAIRAGRALPGEENSAAAAGHAAFLAALGRFVRQMHDAGVFHGDLGGGNILVQAAEEAGGAWSFLVVDVTRCRFSRSAGRVARLRDLARVKLPPERRAPLVEAYASAEPRLAGLARQDRLAFRLYRAKVRAKKLLKGLARR